MHNSLTQNLLSRKVESGNIPLKLISEAFTASDDESLDSTQTTETNKELFPINLNHTNPFPELRMVDVQNLKQLDL